MTMKPMTNKDILKLNEQVNRADKGLLTESNQKFIDKTIAEIAEHEGEDIEDYEEGRSEGDMTVIDGPNGEWNVFEKYDDAEDFALQREKDMLDSEGEDMFTFESSPWLKDFFTASDTDKRLLSGDEADNFVENSSDDELIAYMDMEDDHEKLTEKLDELESKDIDDDDDDAQSENEQAIEDVNDEIEKHIKKAKEDAYDYYYEDVKKQLDDDLVGYFDDQGYGYEKIEDYPIGSVDWDDVAQYVIDSDGMMETTQWIEELDLDKKAVAFKVDD